MNLPKVPGTKVSLISEPSKMPGYSFGLPAKVSCPSMNGDICKSCYAAKGSYLWPVVRNAQSVRFDWTRESMKTSEGQTAWIDTMVAAIRRVTGKVKYFRIHDSGDFFSSAYVRCWIEVCKQLPDVSFWSPTRSWQRPTKASAFQVMGQSDSIFGQVLELAALSNVTVRPSALNFGDEAPVIDGLAAGSTSNNAATKQCPAPKQGNQCLDCRSCWNDKGLAISYKAH